MPIIIKKKVVSPTPDELVSQGGAGVPAVNPALEALSIPPWQT